MSNTQAEGPNLQHTPVLPQLLEVDLLTPTLEYMQCPCYCVSFPKGVMNQST